jgi:hypothetical protein
MRDKLMDKRAIFLPAAAQCKLLAAAAADIPTCGLRHLASRDGGVGASGAGAAAEPRRKRRIGWRVLDSEVLFHVMAAERLVGLGEYRDALDQYLEAALIADDEDTGQTGHSTGGTAGRVGCRH